MAILGMVLNIKASRIATLCVLDVPRRGWVGAICPRCRPQGEEEESALSVDYLEIVIKHTAFYYIHVLTTLSTVVIKYSSLLGQTV